MTWDTIGHLPRADRPDRGAICERGVGEVDRGAVAIGGRGSDGAIAGCERGTRVESPARERSVYGSRLHAQFGEAIGEGSIAIGSGRRGGLDRRATRRQVRSLLGRISPVVINDDFLDLVEAIGKLADLAEDGLVLVELRASPAAQDGILFMLWDDGDRNLKGSQIFDIGKIGPAVLDKTFGLFDGGRGLGEQVVERLVLVDRADFGLVLQVLNVRVRPVRCSGGGGIGNGHVVGGRSRVRRAHD